MDDRVSRFRPFLHQRNQSNRHRFPIYKPNDNKFSIWSESYGGHYGPTFSDFFESQNELIANGTLDSSSVLLHLETVGIVNGCLDILTQMPLYPVMAFNNTYGLQIINETTYQTAMDAWPTCQSMIEECQSLAAANDPLGTGTNADVNTACYDANQYCFLNMWQPYNATGVSSSPNRTAEYTQLTGYSETCLISHPMLSALSRQSMQQDS